MAGLVELKAGLAQLPPERRLVKAEEYAALVEAAAVLAEAQARAAAIAAEAKAAYAAERERGYADGRAEAAMEAAEQQLETLSRTIAWFEQVELEMVEVVIAALQKILGEMDPGELVRRVVHQALRTMRNQRQVTLRVAPEVVDAVQLHLREIMADYPGISFVEVTADSRLRAGGCILESELGVVEATVEVQLDALRRALRRAFVRTV